MERRRDGEKVIEHRTRQKGQREGEIYMMHMRYMGVRGLSREGKERANERGVKE